MKGVLVIAHGSRAKETELTLEKVLARLTAKLPDILIQHAFMEFSEQTIEGAIANLVEKGVNEIKVVPYFLFTGIHLKEDIPQILEKCRQYYPKLKITMSESLGYDDRLADILVDRIKD